MSGPLPKNVWPAPLLRLYPGWLIFLGGLAAGLLGVQQPLLAGALCVLVLLAATLWRVHARLPQLALGFIGVSLVGYAFLGKGYAYLGVPPLFVGELALGAGLLALLKVGRLGTRHTWGLVVLLGLFMLIGLANTLPYLGTYGITALRDAVIWGYAAFALIVAGLGLHLGWVERAVRQYARLIPWFLLFAPLSLILYRLAGGLIPVLPGSDVPLLKPKGGDIAVHLAGILAFLLLGLHRHFSPPRVAERPGREWLWWLLWLIGCLSVFTGRAALLTIAAAAAVLLLLRPLSRWGRPLYLGVLVLTLMTALNVRVDLGVGREVSVPGLLLNLRSITEDTGTSTRDGSREWRLAWWNDIVGYTLHGPYFWTGKGYGINLADADGYQVEEDSSLRSPHNGHLTFLARSGVPGFTAWVLLQAAFALSLLRASFRARAAGQTVWSHLFLWILAYWLAFLVNAAFDVFLEGPQGGIWFWSLFGFGLAALEVYRRQVASPVSPT
ncbi:O-antigen ligase family protein [Deinococcus sp. YIM 77859]|uniref:O-antigen ligase family protein n=1 Tax=Deinococcus sp. YIM 77859 TaxID=1540221 RepID=UPI0009DD159E|nr:O-antigen ligase family protein [Deinococcus sp. YIM 77859]